MYNYVTRVRRTIFEVLAEFRSVKIPRDYLFDVFPTLLPRQFSIASSNIARSTVNYAYTLHPNFSPGLSQTGSPLCCRCTV